MKIMSNCNQSVFFRFFNPRDEAYVAGFDEGFVQRGQTVEYLVPGFGKYKIEFKENGLFGNVLQGAGYVYDNDETFTIQPNGAVVASGSTLPIGQKSWP